MGRFNVIFTQTLHFEYQADILSSRWFCRFTLAKVDHHEWGKIVILFTQLYCYDLDFWYKNTVRK